MKTKLLALLCCLLVTSTNDIVGTYQIVSDRSFDTLEIKSDGSYTYKSRGDSCYTWHDFSGEWELRQDELILKRIHTFSERATEFHETVVPDAKHISFHVKDTFGEPISDFEIKYWCADEAEQIQKTDSNGIAIFNPCLSGDNENESVGVGVKFLTYGNETTVTTSVYKASNSIVLTINSEPKTVNESEEYILSYNNGVLTSVYFPKLLGGSTFKKL